MVDQIKQIATEAANEIIIKQLKTKIMLLEKHIDDQKMIMDKYEVLIQKYAGK